MTYRRRLRIALILAAGTVSPPCLGEPPPSADKQDGNDQPSVYVGDSFEARSAFRRAERLAEAKRWREAAQAYRRAVERFPDKLVRLTSHAYVGPPEYANRRIAAWPDAGLKIYRLLYADQARRQLADARSSLDLHALLTVMDDYFCTRQGARAADLAAQLATEAGDFDLARRLYNRLLANHPDRQALAGGLTAKLALSFVWSGRIDEARALLHRVKSEHARATLAWAGRRRVLADVIADAIARRADPAPTSQAFVWPMLGGNVRRNRVVAGEVRPGAPLWEYGPKQGFRPTTANRSKKDARRAGARVRRERPGDHLSLLPVADETNVYLCDGLTVWAVRAVDGSPCWPPYSVTESAQGPEFTRALGEPRDLHTCVLHAGRLYVILGQPASPTRRDRSRGSGLLACLDVATGKPVWSARLTDLDARLAGIRLDTAPTFYKGKLFAVGRRRKRFGFEDCYLCRFDAVTGRLDWMRHLASASVGSYGLRRATLALATIGEATVFVCTNLGAVAAVNTYDGHLRWLRIYHKDRTEEEAGARLARRVSPWRYTAPICWRDRIICSPLDSERVLVLRRADGEIVRRIDAGQLGHFEQILGIVDDVLYTAGRELVAWDLVRNEARWSRSLATGGGVLGRGQLSRSHVILPMATGLYRFALRGGGPESFDWPEDAVGGNVLLAPGQVIIAGGDRLTGYAPKDQAFARLQRRIEAAPGDPKPLLDLAEVAYRVGERRRAIGALDRAVDVAGGFARIGDPQIKARMFRDFIHFGDKAMEDEPPDESLALKLYQQAAQCPPDPDAQVLYRLRLAEVFVATHRLEQAIRQYQQITADRSLRHRSAHPRDSEVPWPAGQWAERQIGALLARHGRGPYAAFERRAQAMLAVGRERGDVETIQQMIDAFPNARAARQGLVVKAELLEQRGEHRQAIRAYLQVLNREPKRPDAPDIMRRIAAAYLRVNRPSAAGRWLTRGARMFPKYRFAYDGRSVGFAEYRGLVAGGPSAAPPRPKFSLPLAKRWSRQFVGWVSILRPRRTDLPATRWDIYVAYSRGQIEAFTAPGNRPKWAAPVPCKTKPTLLGMTEGRLILVTRQRIFGVATDTGNVAWSIEARPADADRPEVDPEDLRRWTGWTMTEDRVFGLRDDGQAVCVDAKAGRVRWRARLSIVAETPAVANDEFFIYQGPTAQWQGLVARVLDAETGRPLRKIEADVPGRISWMELSGQGQLYVATGRRLYALDPYTGKLAWKSATTLPNFRASLFVGSGGLYLSHNGRTLVRRSVQSGQVTAESVSLLGAERGGIITAIDDGRLFARTQRAVTALDARTMKPLWRGTTDRNANLVRHEIGRRYVVAIDRRTVLRDDGRHERYIAYFYDRRDDSGVIPAEGGVVDLGSHRNGRGVHFADHTVLVVDGATIHGWTGPGD